MKQLKSIVTNSLLFLFTFLVLFAISLSQPSLSPTITKTATLVINVTWSNGTAIHPIWCKVFDPRFGNWFDASWDDSRQAYIYEIGIGRYDVGEWTFQVNCSTGVSSYPYVTGSATLTVQPRPTYITTKIYVGDQTSDRMYIGYPAKIVIVYVDDIDKKVITDGSCTVDVTSPSGSKESYELNLFREEYGGYVLEYTPQEEGDYKLDITCSATGYSQATYSLTIPATKLGAKFEWVFKLNKYLVDNPVTFIFKLKEDVTGRYVTTYQCIVDKISAKNGPQPSISLPISATVEGDKYRIDISGLEEGNYSIHINCTDPNHLPVETWVDFEVIKVQYPTKYLKGNLLVPEVVARGNPVTIRVNLTDMNNNPVVGAYCSFKIIDPSGKAIKEGYLFDSQLGIYEYELMTFDLMSGTYKVQVECSHPLFDNIFTAERQFEIKGINTKLFIVYKYYPEFIKIKVLYLYKVWSYVDGQCEFYDWEGKKLPSHIEGKYFVTIVKKPEDLTGKYVRVVCQPFDPRYNPIEAIIPLVKVANKEVDLIVRTFYDVSSGTFPILILEANLYDRETNRYVGEPYCVATVLETGEKIEAKGGGLAGFTRMRIRITIPNLHISLVCWHPDYGVAATTLEVKGKELLTMKVTKRVPNIVVTFPQKPQVKEVEVEKKGVSIGSVLAMLGLLGIIILLII